MEKNEKLLRAYKDYQRGVISLEEYNSIATVSTHCESVLKEIFPEYAEKFTVINNIIEVFIFNNSTIIINP